MKQIKLYLLLVLLGGNFVFAQDSFVETSNYLELKSRAPQYARNGRGFSMDNFSVGIKGGINFSLAIPLSRSSVFSGQSPEDYEKDYNFFLQNMGMQMGFILMYDINRMIKVSVQPSSNDYTYKYSNTYTWDRNNRIAIRSGVRAKT
jgi:hypothetical protein